MQILTLHAMIGLQTEYEANWTKKWTKYGIFGPVDPPGPTQQANLASLHFVSSFYNNQDKNEDDRHNWGKL